MPDGKSHTYRDIAPHDPIEGVIPRLPVIFSPSEFAARLPR
jgi:hypothetical protein